MFIAPNKITFSQTPADKNGGRRGLVSLIQRQNAVGETGCRVEILGSLYFSIRARIARLVSMVARGSNHSWTRALHFAQPPFSRSGRNATGDGLNSRRRPTSFESLGLLGARANAILSQAPAIQESQDCRCPSILPRLRDLALVRATVRLFAPKSPQARRRATRGVLSRALFEPDSLLNPIS